MPQRVFDRIKDLPQFVTPTGVKHFEVGVGLVNAEQLVALELVHLIDSKIQWKAN